MSDIRGLAVEHAAIFENVTAIECLAVLSNISKDIGAIVNTMKLIAYRINYQLQAETEFVHQRAADFKNSEIENFTEEYIEHGKKIYKEYEKYKKRFNTKGKILGNIDEFKRETAAICKLLKGMLKDDTKVICKLRHNKVN